MKRLLAAAAAFVLVVPSFSAAQQRESYDYWRFQRDMIQHGVQAVLQCNGLFTSHRTLEQVFAQELAYLRQPVARPGVETTWWTGTGRRWPSAPPAARR